MSDTFLTFQKFNDPELAAIIAAQLNAQGIETEIDNEKQVFDPSFVNNDFESTIHLKLQPADFIRARTVLEAYYQPQLDTMPPDYYLFSFTDAELQDLVKHWDEWGILDYALAKKLLAERGSPITPEREADLQHNRLKTLTKPEASSWLWIYIGYTAAITGGILGIILGYVLAYLKKTLPNGDLVYSYTPDTRKHGKRILVLSIISFIYWAWRFLSGYSFRFPWLQPL